MKSYIFNMTCNCVFYKHMKCFVKESAGLTPLALQDENMLKLLLEFCKICPRIKTLDNFGWTTFIPDDQYKYDDFGTWQITYSISCADNLDENSGQNET